MIKKLKYINILKGLGMILVVLGHTKINEHIRKYIYSFHMPLFFMISGYLSKDEISLKKIKDKFKKLIGAYFYYLIISFIIPVIYVISNKSIESFGYDWTHILYLNGKLIWNTPLWFLMSLFFLEIFFIIFSKILKNKFVKISLFLGINLYFYKFKIFLPFGISISLASLTLYYIGKLIKENNNYFHKKINNVTLFIFGFLSLILSLYNGRVDLYKLSFSDNIVLYYIVVLLNFIFYLEISKKIEKSNQNFVNIIAYLGENSLIILGTHYIIIWFYRVTINLILNKLDINFKILETYGLTAIVVLAIEIILIKGIHILKLRIK